MADRTFDRLLITEMTVYVHSCKESRVHWFLTGITVLRVLSSCKRSTVTLLIKQQISIYRALNIYMKSQ